MAARPWQPLVPAKGAEEGTLFFGNDLYTVQVKGTNRVEAEGWADVMHVTVHRRDRSPIIDWRHLQRIKNELGGEDSEAVQLFPAEDRLVDTANEFHLWLFRPGYRIPFGMDTGRLVMDADPVITGSKQRPLAPNTEGITTTEEWKAMLREHAPHVAKSLGI